jgi:hypothetical protein
VGAAGSLWPALGLVAAFRNVSGEFCEEREQTLTPEEEPLLFPTGRRRKAQNLGERERDLARILQPHKIRKFKQVEEKKIDLLLTFVVVISFSDAGCDKMRATFIPDIACPLLPLRHLTHHFLSISSVSSSRSPFCCAFHPVHNKLLLYINNCDPVHSSRSPGHFFQAGAIPGVTAMASGFRPETARQPPVERPPTPPNGGRVSYLSLSLCSSSSKKRIWNS